MVLFVIIFCFFKFFILEILCFWFFCGKRIFKLLSSFKICFNFCLLLKILFRVGVVFIFRLCRICVFFISIFVVLNLNNLVSFLSWFFECLCDFFKVEINLIFNFVLEGFFIIFDFLNWFCIIWIWNILKMKMVFMDILVEILLFYDMLEYIFFYSK